MSLPARTGHQDRGVPSAPGAGHGAGHDHLATELRDLARVLEGEDDPEAVLTAIVQAATRMVPGAEEGSITLVLSKREVRSRAASSELARTLDVLQEATGEGPCLDAAFQHTTVRVPDMAAEQRWPSFARAADAAGAHAMLCFQLFVHGEDLGALNLYARTAHAFTGESEHIGVLVAAHAAVAYAGARKHEHMEQALDTRDLIGQAKGILMERYKITGQQAFQVLIRVSNNHNSKLRDVAGRLVESGELDLSS